MSHYPLKLYPFRYHRLNGNQVVAVSETGDFAFLSQPELLELIDNPDGFQSHRLAELKSKYFVGNPNLAGSLQLLLSRLTQKKETILSGPSLHAIVPTLYCQHTCSYCQVSRSLTDSGYSLSEKQITQITERIFDSQSHMLTVEFQGGDPLLRFDLVKQAIEAISHHNKREKRDVRFIVSSTLHQLTPEMCAFFKEYSVFLSTSIDGPPELHNKHRRIKTRDAYERTVAGISLAREYLGSDAVSALMTTTYDSLSFPEAIVDEYVNLGFSEIFIRPISIYGFAKRNQKKVGYTEKKFTEFYNRAFEHILGWNRQGYALREVSAAIALNKMLSPFDAGYVDLQSPSGAGLACLVYNYDGYVYPSDEARMLAESGDTSLRLGKIEDSLQHLLTSDVSQQLVKNSLSQYVPGCQECAFSTYCGPDPVSMHAEYGSMSTPVIWSSHCQRQKQLFDMLFRKLAFSDTWFEDLAYSWAHPS